MSTETVLAKASATGTICFSRTTRKDGDPPCVCCPGQPGHIFSRQVEFDPFDSNFRPSLDNHVGAFLDQTALRNIAFEGKRVRVTVEVLDGTVASIPEESPPSLVENALRAAGCPVDAYTVAKSAGVAPMEAGRLLQTLILAGRARLADCEGQNGLAWLYQTA